MTTRIQLSRPQLEFAGTDATFPCFCGGFGAGKTFVGVVRALKLKCAYPKLDVGYYLPTYDLVKKVGYPSFLEVMEMMQIRGRLLKGDHEIEIANAGKIIFRSMDAPERIVGYKVADSIVDELDTLKTEAARAVWFKILGRQRQKKPDGRKNTVGVVTTPEGFRFIYETWKKKPGRGYKLIKATSYSNQRNLPDDYLRQLADTYPTQLLLAYLNGEFVNLTAGAVYPEFKRELNGSTETIKDKEHLHVGMDFNVTKMAAVVYVLRNDEPHAVGELTDIFDTPAMSKSIIERYKDKGHPITVYPDASGESRKSNNASTSDIAILRQSGFSVCVNSTNPAVKDRVLATNALIHSGGKRRLHVNTDACPRYTEALEQQVYDKNGEPDKSSGHDHVIDAGTYPIAYRWPIVKPTVTVTPLRM